MNFLEFIRPPKKAGKGAPEPVPATADTLRTALTEVQQSGPQEGLRIDGREATEPALRDGLEATYRQLADQAQSRPERIALVDQANEVRGWTLR